MDPNIILHDFQIEADGLECQETLTLIGDVRDVSSSLYQAMPVIGPWFEARVAWLVEQRLPKWKVGSGQIYDSDRPGMRSRSWDIIVYQEPKDPKDLPPAPYPGGMRPLVEKSNVCAVIDTKMNFSDAASYTSKSAFNLMNDCEESQIDFLGNEISKNIFVFMTSSAPNSVERIGKKHGLNVFIIGKYLASPVSDAQARQLVWRVSAQGEPALSRFRRELLHAADRWLGNRET